MPVKSTNIGGQGGRRSGSGRKKKIEKDMESESSRLRFSMMNISDDNDNATVDDPHSYLDEKQADGTELIAIEIYKNTMRWLERTGCSHLIAQSVVEFFAMSTARYVQCEEEINKKGLLAQHPTTGNPTYSPFFNMAIQYMNQATKIWNDMYQIVKENCTIEVSSSNSQDDLMEKLLGG